MCDLNDLYECQPLKTLDSILNWEKPNPENWAKFTKKINDRSQFCYLASSECENVPGQKFHRKDAPKTLFCHDMKGGYLEDRFVDGCDKNDSYAFSYWSAIDIFVYFSHSLLTIPPLSWINAGHTHGVLVLGTLITEWDSGKAIWNEILSDTLKRERFCLALVDICDHYGFDGYLLNVENELGSGAEGAVQLANFVGSLTKLLKARWREKGGGEEWGQPLVIWYDAVTSTGQLKHQNKLNSFNKLFFDACDGIFINYCWKEEGLRESLALAGAERSRDIFVGVDVWGRGCIGGGGFNTNEAVILARRLDLSVALFGCGWTHENADPADPFEYREPLFWKIVGPHLYLHGPNSLPFTTSFCRGFGRKRHEHGIVVSSSSWHNLSEQCYQPTDLFGAEGFADPPCLSYCQSDAYKGGGCLLLSPSTTLHEHRIFVCEFHINEMLRVRTLTKPMKENSSSHLIIVLLLDESSGASRKIYLEDDELHSEKNGIVDVVSSKPFQLIEKNSWIFREFEIEVRKPSILTRISCISRGDGPILLGELSIEGT